MVAMAESGLRTEYEYDGRTRTSSTFCASSSACYVYGSYIDEVLCMQKADSTRYYYSTNDLYSVYCLTDSNGDPVERYMYDPYGKVTVLDQNGNPKADPTYSEYGNPWTFTGRRLDQETGLMYYRNRMYDVGLGRFIGRDSIGYANGMGLYGAYFVPSGVDPSGLIVKQIKATKGQIKGPEEMYNGGVPCGTLTIQGLADADLVDNFEGNKRTAAFESGWRPKGDLKQKRAVYYGAWIDINFTRDPFEPEKCPCCPEDPCKFGQIGSLEVGKFKSGSFVDVHDDPDIPLDPPDLAYGSTQDRSFRKAAAQKGQNPVPPSYQPDPNSRIRDYAGVEKYPQMGAKQAFVTCLYCDQDRYWEKPFLKVKWDIEYAPRRASVTLTLREVTTANLGECNMKGLPIGGISPGMKDTRRKYWGRWGQ